MNNPLDNQGLLDDATIAMLTKTINDVEQLCYDLTKFVMSAEARQSVSALMNQNEQLRKATSALLFDNKKHCHECMANADILEPIHATETNECLECYKQSVYNEVHDDFLGIVIEQDPS
jgi:predicted Ser/Thr protein kinase